MIGLAANQDDPQHQSQNELSRHQAQLSLMRRAADTENDEAKAQRGQKRAEKIEAMFGARRRRQGPNADRHRHKAEGNVDRKQPGPGPERENTGSNRRPEGEGGADDHRVITISAAEHAAWIYEADQRRIHAHEAAGAEALKYPPYQQARQRPGAGASERRNREQQHPAEINALV